MTDNFPIREIMRRLAGTDQIAFMSLVGHSSCNYHDHGRHSEGGLVLVRAFEVPHYSHVFVQGCVRGKSKKYGKIESKCD